MDCFKQFILLELRTILRKNGEFVQFGVILYQLFTLFVYFYLPFYALTFVFCIKLFNILTYLLI